MTSKRLALKNNVLYALYQFIFGMLTCSAVAFVSVFMLGRGYSNSTVGVIIGVANLAAVLIQPATAAILDRSRKLTVWLLVAIESLIGIALCFWLASTSGNGLLPAVIFTAICAVEMSMTAPLNTISRRMHGVNYGAGRAFNSLAYAMVSASLGIVFDLWSLELLPFIIAGTYIALFLVSLLVRKSESFPEAETKEETVAVKSGNPIRDGKFIVFLLSNFMLFFAYFMIVNCMIQICRSVGGDTKEMGTAFAIGSVLEPIMMFMMSRILKKISCRTMLIFSSLMIMLKSIIFLAASSVSYIYAAQTLQMVGFAALYPSTVYYVDSLCDRHNAAKGQGYLSAALGAGGVIASFFGGKLIDDFGVKQMIAFDVAIAAVGVLLMILGTKKIKVSTEPSE